MIRITHRANLVSVRRTPAHFHPFRHAYGDFPLGAKQTALQLHRDQLTGPVDRLDERKGVALHDTLPLESLHVVVVNYLALLVGVPAVPPWTTRSRRKATADIHLESSAVSRIEPAVTPASISTELIS
ncbi:MAG TPA: hypothetical protein PKA49_06770 [Tepidiformaceae bacterium]|nr:hypothetical protein [Tepidiformaceae bacterium]